MKDIEKISNDDLELYAEKVKNDQKYGGEGILIDEALKTYPKNNEKSIVAMKICLIDITNGTNLSRNLGKKGGLYKLTEKIVNSNFDERVKDGDLTLVEEIAQWTKNELGKNLFSFMTKYCLYHNIHCYNKDDYAIYDSVVSNNLYKFISNDDFYNITGKKLCKNSFSKMRYSINYIDYMKVLDFIINSNHITVDSPHRKLDWYIWYKYR